MYSGSIVFILRKDYVSVRYNYTSRISEILNQIIETYESTVSKDIHTNEIDLSGISDADFRNNFAVHLYDFDGNYNKTGFEYAGLEKVRVSRIKTNLNVSQGDTSIPSPETDTEDDLSDGDNRNLSDDDYEADIAKDDDENLTFNINNASYDGLSLVNAPQIKELCNDGFYRSLIRWKSLTSLIKDHIITLELSFDDKYHGQNIKFRVLHKESNTTPSTREKLSDAEFDQIMKQLEEKIFLINDFILEEHAKRYPEVNTGICASLNQEAG